MHYQRHDKFIYQSPAAARPRARRIGLEDDRYLMSRSPRRSLSPSHGVGRGQRVLGGDRRSNSLDYWDSRGHRRDRVRSRSPALERVRRPDYDVNVSVSKMDSSPARMHRRFEYNEYVDVSANVNAGGLCKEYDYIRNTSRVIREDIDRMLSPNSNLEDGIDRGMYRLPVDTGPTSNNMGSGGSMSLTSMKVGLDWFKDEKVQFSDPSLSEKFPGIVQHDSGEKPMFHLRHAPYPTVPPLQSKDLMGSSQFRDFGSTSSQNSTRNFPKSNWDDIPLSRDRYYKGSGKVTEHAGFGGERLHLDSGRNYETENKDLAGNTREPFGCTSAEHDSYLYNRALLRENNMLDTVRDPKAENDAFSPNRTLRRDLYPRPLVRETDDHLATETHRMVPERINHDSRPRIMDPVAARYDTIEFSRRKPINSTLWYYHSPDQQPFKSYIGMGRSLAASKEAGQCIDSVTAQGRKLSREQEIPHIGDSNDCNIMLPIKSNYGLARDVGLTHRKEKMGSPRFLYETERRRLSPRRVIERDDYVNYNTSNRVPKRNPNSEKEIYWYDDSRNIVPRKWNNSSRAQEQDDRSEEWIDQQRSLYLSKQVADDQDFNRRDKRLEDRRDRHRVSAYEDRFSSYEPDEQMLEHSFKPHKSGDKYFKGNSRPGSVSWNNANHYNRKNVLCKPNNVWIRTKDHDQVDAHSYEVEQSDKMANSSKSEPSEDSEEFQQLVHKYFLSFSRKLNENPSVRKRYKEQGRAGSLFCIVCGRRESKVFTDTIRLITHAFMSHKVGLRALHLGLHKAICVLLGWNSVVSPDVVTWSPETLTNAEALAQKEDLIIWPPLIVIHNESERQRGTTVEALEDFLRGKGIISGKVKTVSPSNLNILVVKFLGTFSGLQDSEKLHEYFAENKRGRIEFEKKSSSKGKRRKIVEGEVEEDKVDELVLYGYMGIAEDLDQVDFDTRRKCSIRSKKEIQEIVNAPVKPE